MHLGKKNHAIVVVLPYKTDEVRKFEETTVAAHKFKVGQRVRFDAPALRLASRVADPDAPKENYEIMQLLPPSGSELQYRIRGGAVGLHRVVTENEIDLVAQET